MPITVVTPASGKRLTTTSALAPQLGIASPTSTQTTEMEALIDRASDFITSYIGYPLGKATYLETFISPVQMAVYLGGFRLVTSRVPVLSITEIKLKDTVIDSDKYFIEDADAGFIFKDDRFNTTTVFSGPINASPSRFAYYNWSVTYEAGYALPGDSGRDLPYDLEWAALELAKAMHFETGIDQNLRREQIGEAGIWYHDPSMSQKKQKDRIMSILDEYKRTQG